MVYDSGGELLFVYIFISFFTEGFSSKSLLAKTGTNLAYSTLKDYSFFAVFERLAWYSGFDSLSTT
jgi:hypothetical protein